MTAFDPGRPPAPVSRGTDSLADILERVLDKGIVIAGDVMVNVLDIELLTLKVRLLVASVDTARQMGIDWWTADPFLNSGSATAELRRENDELRRRLERLERTALPPGRQSTQDAAPGAGAGAGPPSDAEPEQPRRR